MSPSCCSRPSSADSNRRTNADGERAAPQKHLRGRPHAHLLKSRSYVRDLLLIFVGNICQTDQEAVLVDDVAAHEGRNQARSLLDLLRRT